MRLERIVRWDRIVVALVLTTAACAVPQESPSLAGRWDATVIVNDLEIPFPFEIAEDGRMVTGSFFNGELAITSTDGTFENGMLELAFAQYASKIEATYANGRLEGQYVRGVAPPVSLSGASGGGEDRCCDLGMPRPSPASGSFRPRATRAKRPGASSSGRRGPRCRAGFSVWTATPALSLGRIVMARSS